MASTSSIVYEHLKTKERGFTFTNESMFKELSELGHDVTPGGVSGFTAKAANNGFLERVRKSRSDIRYVLLDVNGIRVKKGSSKGGAVGRKITGGEDVIVSYKSIQERLLELAADLEKVRSPMSEFSTNDLLSELMRRNATKS